MMLEWFLAIGVCVLMVVFYAVFLGSIMDIANENADRKLAEEKEDLEELIEDGVIDRKEFEAWEKARGLAPTRCESCLSHSNVVLASSAPPRNFATDKPKAYGWMMEDDSSEEIAKMMANVG